MSEAVAGSAPQLSSADRAAAIRYLAADSPSEDLDRLAVLAGRLLQAPMAQVSLLTDVQTVLGSAGQPDGTTGSTGPLADSLCTVTARSGGPLVVANAFTDQRVSALPPVTAGVVGSYLGIPLLTSDGQRVGALCVFGPEPRDWATGDVELLRELAASTMAEMELGALGHDVEAERARWALAIDAAGIGTFDWDLVTGRLAWDARLIALFGYEEEGFDESIEAFNARLHSDDLPRVTHLLETAIATCGEYEAEYRIVLPGGETRWIAARGRALCGDDGRAFRLIGAAYDTTAVREGEARVARVLESMPTAFFSLDKSWRFSYVNAEAERVLGRSREELTGGVIWELFPHAIDSDFERQYRSAAETGEPTSFEAFYPEPLEAWYEVRAWPGPDGLSVYFHDVTKRRAAQESALAAARRTELLASVSEELSATLNVEEAVGRLARAVLPALGQWSVVSLLDDNDDVDLALRVRDVGSWHVDPAGRDLVAAYSAVRMSQLRDTSLLEAALSSVSPIVVDGDVVEAITAKLAPGTARELLRKLAPGHLILAAIHARGKPLGLLAVYADDAPSDAGWVADAVQDVAARAGLALENGRLYDAQRRLAEDLQRSLLTEPPAPDHLEVRVAYQAAQAVASVGGDWYDAFLQPDGHTVLVIGDVVGHDTQAAAEMGQVRALLRGIAVTTGEGPAAVLTRLDAALQLLQVDTTATAVVLRIEQTDEERAAGLRRVRWSNAGHPPPVLVVDGKVTLLDEREPDLLLGIDPGTTRSEGVVVVPSGSTVLLYTDGLVERRGESLEVGLSRLQDVLAGAHAEREPALLDLVGTVLGKMADEYDDDVAIAAVRLHPQDAPRPAEAGPSQTPTGLPADPTFGAPTVEPHRILLPGEPRSASRARRFLRESLAGTELEELADDAELALSELVTNAVLHAHTDIEVTVRPEPGRLRIEVADGSAYLPEESLPAGRRPDEDVATTGRGIALVAALTSEHGVIRREPEGKVVWFCLTATDASPQGSTTLQDGTGWHADDAGRAPEQARHQVEVTLLGLPPTLWQAASLQHDAALRELALLRAGRDTLDLAAADRARFAVAAALADALAAARDAGAVRDPLPAGHPATLEHVPPVVDLPLRLGETASADFSALQDVLDEAQRLALAGQTLTPPALPEVVAVRDWAAEQVVTLLAGEPARPWPGADAEDFVTVVEPVARTLADEVAELLHGRDSAIVVDSHNRIVAVTPELAADLGWDADELAGRRVVALVPPRYRESHTAGFTRHLTTGEARALDVDLQLPVLHAAGHEVVYTFRIEAHTASGRPLYVAWLSPAAS